MRLTSLGLRPRLEAAVAYICGIETEVERFANP